MLHSPARKYPTSRKIRTNGLIHLDQAEVIINQPNLPAKDIAKESGRIAAKDINGNRQVALPVSKAPLASLATNGVYVVRGINYKGDTRGQEWYMDMVCEVRGADDLKSEAAREKGMK